jgi:hypothetical protein
VRDVDGQTVHLESSRQQQQQRRQQAEHERAGPGREPIPG